MKWNPIMPFDQLWDGDHVSIKFENQRVLLLRQGEEVFAYFDSCPHLGMPLNEGTVAGGAITCRYHGWVFDIKSGKGINPCTEALIAVPVLVKNDQIFLALTQGEKAEA